MKDRKLHFKNSHAVLCSEFLKVNPSHSQMKFMFWDFKKQKHGEVFLEFSYILTF